MYADKVAGGSLWGQPGCQKKRKKYYASGLDQRGPITGRRPISERHKHIEAKYQMVTGKAIL